jgi:Domain of unknown function (DUF5658)
VSPLSKSILLFALNWLDAQLTILWVRLNIATEGNGAMAHLLNLGEAPFLVTKLAIGAFAAYVLYRSAHLAMSRRGMKLVLAVYVAIMGVHAFTGFAALGWKAPEAVLTYFVQLPGAVLALFT